MNVYEMISMFDSLLLEVSPSFEVQERVPTDTTLMVLNIAQLRFFKDTYMNHGTHKETSEYLKKVATSDLQKLIRTYSNLTVSAASDHNSPYSYVLNNLITTSLNYAHYIESYTKRSATQPKTIAESWVVNNVADSLDDLKRVETNAYNTPILRNPIVYFDGGQNHSSNNTIYIYLLTDSYTTVAASNNFTIRYLRYPKALGYSDNTTITNVCEINPVRHEEIVRLALDIYLKEYKFLLTPGK